MKMKVLIWIIAIAVFVGIAALSIHMKSCISESAQFWWDGLSEEDKQEIFNLPNFDADIFRECTGIEVMK